ncbi:zf-HC2 domain-containing protein, partial [bacterium]|nr:zf-HC2 domain-containing protein [bacterium]
MNGQDNNQQDLSCTACTGTLQEYLDGTLEKTQSLRVFLHLRDCAAC